MAIVTKTINMTFDKYDFMDYIVTQSHKHVQSQLVKQLHTILKVMF